MALRRLQAWGCTVLPRSDHGERQRGIPAFYISTQCLTESSSSTSKTRVSYQPRLVVDMSEGRCLQPNFRIRLSFSEDGWLLSYVVGRVDLWRQNLVFRGPVEESFGKGKDDQCQKKYKDKSQFRRWCPYRGIFKYIVKEGRDPSDLAAKACETSTCNLGWRCCRYSSKRGLWFSQAR